MKHFTRAKAVQGGLLAAAALLVAGAAPAQAMAQQARPGNWLYFTVTQGDSRSGSTHSRLLLCSLPRQAHPRSADACAELEAVGGDVKAIQPRDVMCPMVYAPVTVKARGQWNGRPVSYTQTFSSACEMEAQTGAVFAMDN